MLPTAQANINRKKTETAWFISVNASAATWQGLIHGQDTRRIQKIQSGGL